MTTDPENVTCCRTTVFMDPGFTAAPRPGMTASVGYRVALWIR
jgi:hypothetical protein